MEISSLSMGDVLDIWGSLLLLVCQLLGWGRILSVHLLLLVSPPSIFSEMKLETSFSTVSHYIFLALTQSSKVLKLTLLVLCFTYGILKGIKFVLTFPTVSWEAIFFIPDLPMVLKEVCLLLFLTKSLSRTCTRVLKGVNFCLHCSLLPRVPWTGVLKWVSTLSFSLLARIPFIWRVLKWVSNSVAKSSCGVSVDCSSCWVCLADLWPEMTKLSSLLSVPSIYEGLERGSWKELILSSLCSFQHEGLERGSWNESNLHPFCPHELLLCSDLLLGHLQGTLPSIFVILVRLLGFASVAVTVFAIFLHITFIRPNLTLTGCPTMISLHVGVSTTKNWWSWKDVWALM